jgi:hypothetical protein
MMTKLPNTSVLMEIAARPAPVSTHGHASYLWDSTNKVLSH